LQNANREHAIVIGGSIAGLCAARVLSEHFELVTVLDRDRFPEEGQHRKGVPQSRHPHVLLDAGRKELDRLFPGFEALCRERGGLELNPGLDFATLQQTGWSRRRSSPFTMLFASRVLIEGAIRELAAHLSNVSVRQESEVTGLLTEKDGGLRVTGVTVRWSDGAETELSADLVVDASGRATKVPGWLEKLGLPPTEMTVVDASAGYSSRWYQGPPPDQRPSDWWWKCLWIEPLIEGAERPEEQYFGVLFPVEQDRWVVTTASWGGQELASDPEEFDRMIAKLRTPVLADAIARAEPISPVFARRGMQNCWRHYERWRGELAGFIAMGDAVCAFNPVYGQGMSSASKCALVLEACLAEQDPLAPDFPARFFRSQAEFLGIPWMMAVSRDRERVRIEGDDPTPPRRLEALARRVGAFVMGQLALASRRDDAVSLALFEVVNLTRTPGELLRDPGVLARAARARVRQWLSRETVDEDAIPDYPPAAISE
jgi:2-polyprenyl-6-methoxyphenol hydroxylase-like FAD-dependent oxidoreductase